MSGKSGILEFGIDRWFAPFSLVRLVYDPDTHTTSDSPGVETRCMFRLNAIQPETFTLISQLLKLQLFFRIPGFGNTTSVEFIDKSMRSFSTYFALIVAGLVKREPQLKCL